MFRVVGNAKCENGNVKRKLEEHQEKTTELGQCQEHSKKTQEKDRVNDMYPTQNMFASLIRVTKKCAIHNVDFTVVAVLHLVRTLGSELLVLLPPVLFLPDNALLKHELELLLHVSAPNDVCLNSTWSLSCRFGALVLCRSWAR